jgi:hypothetical protein
MGTKFANLQIKGLPVTDIQKLIPRSIAKSFSNGWTTIVREDFQIELIDQEARKLSKKIDMLVVAIGYYDDDVFTISLFRNGKKIVNHISNNAYGFTKKIGNPAVFVQELGLEEECKKYLKFIFKCENIYKKIELLEKLLGVPLWLDSQMMGELIENNIEYKSDIAFVNQYIKEIDTYKIKNELKVKILMELEGMLRTKVCQGKLLIITPNENGKYYLENARLFNICENGTLCTLLKDNSITFDSTCRLLSNGNIVAVYEGCKTIDHKRVGEASITITTIDGDIIKKLNCDMDAYNPMLLFPDASVLYYEPIKEIISKYDNNGIKLWELSVGYLHVPPIIYNNYIFLHYENRKNNKAEILKINQSGNTVARFELHPRGGSHWNKFLFDNNGDIYYSCCLQSNHDYHSKLLQFDNDLQKIKEFDLPDISFDGIIDLGQNRIYISIFEKEILAIDLNSFQICASKNYDDADLLSIDKQGRVLIQKGSSTIETLNDKLHVVSRNRLKGEIYGIYKNLNEDIYIITGNDVNYDCGKADKCLLWVNKLVRQ